MRSLRARLVAGLVVLAAIGLLLLGGIIYAEQRSTSRCAARRSRPAPCWRATA
jgi:hypothetical protein